MKSFLIKYATIIGFAFTVVSCEQKDPAPATLNHAIDNIVNPYVVLGADVGIIIGVIKDGQKTIYSYGEKELGSKEKLTSQSVLEIASLTKIYTSVALANLHLKGELNLDDPIENYLPSTVHVPEYNNKKITLRHLANHSSGFPRDPDNVDHKAYNKYKDYTEEKMYDFINNYKLTREPGTKVAYSNVGYGLLGEILSLKNNSNYEDAITKQVLQPLGMSHTTITFTNDQIPNVAQGYNGNEAVESWSKYMQNIVQGGGALISSMDDQLIYMEANLGLKQTPLADAMNLTHEFSLPYASPRADGIGLGWTHYNTSDGQKIIWKNGGNGGYTSFMGLNKNTKTGVIVMTNSALNPDLFQTDIGFEILKELNK